MPGPDPETFAAATQLVSEALGHHRAGRLPQAEEGYRKALELVPEHADALNLLGMLGLDCGYAEDAIDLLRRAVASDPSVAAYGLNLGNALTAASRFDEAEAAYRAAMDLQQGNAAIPYNLGILHLRRGQDEDALAAFEAALALEPEHRRARFLVTALSGGHVDSPPAEYVSDLFDDYAEGFESHLRDRLGYRIPEKLRELVVGAANPKPQSWTVLDLGCGTGICGSLFRNLADQLVGSDLSPRMIEKSRDRGIYDQLYHEDLVDTLRRFAGEVDLAVAADVFIYVGDLAPTFAASALALRSGGLLAFSTERHAGDGFRLHREGRFAHSEGYIRELAARNGLGVVSAEAAVIRAHKGQPLEGQIFLLRR